MKVTVDTRFDSLEEALATVHAAFGSSKRSPASAAIATQPATVPGARRPTAKGTGSRNEAATSSATNKTPAKRTTTGTLRNSTSTAPKNARTRKRATKTRDNSAVRTASPTNRISNMAPTGQ